MMAEELKEFTEQFPSAGAIGEKVAGYAGSRA